MSNHPSFLSKILLEVVFYHGSPVSNGSGCFGFMRKFTRVMGLQR
jgi:hypothetical protein